jgi:hypothetical protein
MLGKKAKLQQIDFLIFTNVNIAHKIETNINASDKVTRGFFG